jgi:hypothetical protein
MCAIREVFSNARVPMDRTANDLSRNFASRSIKMIPRGAGVGNIRREATKARSTFVARDESQERWKHGKAEPKDLSSEICRRRHRQCRPYRPHSAATAAGNLAAGLSRSRNTGFSTNSYDSAAATKVSAINPAAYRWSDAAGLNLSPR